MNPTPTTGIAPVSAKSLPPYAPTSTVDFSKPEHRAAFEQALAEVRGEFGREYPTVVGGERVKGAGTFESRNPARPSEVLASFQSSTKEQAAQAVDAAHHAFATWSRVPATERAAYLIEAAKRMRERRHHFSAWMTLEIGKSWAEAALQAPVLPVSWTRFRLPWAWTGEPVLLQSRATDEKGNVQTTREKWSEQYSVGNVYHYNAMQTWSISPAGEITNVYL